MSLHYNCQCAKCEEIAPTQNRASLLAELAQTKLDKERLEKEIVYMKETMAYLSSGELPDGSLVDHNVAAFASSTLKYCERVYAKQ